MANSGLSKHKNARRIGLSRTLMDGDEHGKYGLRLRQPLIAWARRAAMERNRSRYRTMAAKQRRRAGLHFMLRSRDILRPPDHLVSHYEQIDALVLLPILEINETGTE